MKNEDNLVKMWGTSYNGVGVVFSTMNARDNSIKKSFHKVTPEIYLLTYDEVGTVFISDNGFGVHLSYILKLSLRKSIANLNSKLFK